MVDVCIVVLVLVSELLYPYMIATVMLHGIEMEMGHHACFLLIFIHSFLMFMSFHYFNGKLPYCKHALVTEGVILSRLNFTVIGL